MMRRDAREEKAIVLDFLPNGYPFDSRPSHMKTPIAQAMGKEHFILIELVPKKGVFLQSHKEVYIGEGKRDEIHHITGRIPLDKLTQTAKMELNALIEILVKQNPDRFVQFFNQAGPINTRRHQIELLPGIGKKHMWEIIEERKGNPFKSFEDIKARVKLMPNPEKAVIKRILLELKGDDKHRIFVGS
jgi:putative nucleotide binding protein